MAWVINLHKIVTLFIVLGMIFYFDNFSTAACVYLGLHGIYGYCWLIKDFGFRDGSFETRVGRERPFDARWLRVCGSLSWKVRVQ